MDNNPCSGYSYRDPSAPADADPARVLACLACDDASCTVRHMERHIAEFACHNPRCELHLGSVDVNPYAGWIGAKEEVAGPGFGNGDGDGRRRRRRRRSKEEGGDERGGYGRDRDRGRGGRGSGRGYSRPRRDGCGIGVDEGDGDRRTPRRRASRRRRDAERERRERDERLGDYDHDHGYPVFEDDVLRGRRHHRRSRYERERFDDGVHYSHVNVKPPSSCGDGRGYDPVDEPVRGGDRMRARFERGRTYDAPYGGSYSGARWYGGGGYYMGDACYECDRDAFMSTPLVDPDRLRRRFTARQPSGYPPSSNHSFYYSYVRVSRPSIGSDGRRARSRHGRSASRGPASQPQPAHESGGKNPWYEYAGTEGPDGEIIDGDPRPRERRR
ncbi:hypothetical protein VTK26DRAFT_7074 [Humicola hyalothermophila]